MKQNNYIKKAILFFIIAELVITFFLGSIYVAVQQNIRLSANDLPAEIAENIQNYSAKNSDIEKLMPTEKVDLDKSLSPFYILIDTGGKAALGNAQLDGKLPTIAKGVLNYTKAHGDDRITWQPKDGVREAIVVKPLKNAEGGFVLVGHSLREYENRTQSIFGLIVLLWAVASLVNLTLVLFAIFINKTNLKTLIKNK